MSYKRDFWYGTLLLGSLWGGVEALISATMDGVSSPIPRSVVLAFVAVLMLSVGRRLMPSVGTTLAAGIVAAAMKLLSMPAMMACQFTAVIGQAVILEAFFSISERLQFTERRLPLSVGIVAASYVNSLVFAFSQAYVFQNNWWMDRGVSGLLEWSFVTGSGAALASWVSFTAGWYLGRRMKSAAGRPAINVIYWRGASLVISGAIWCMVAL